MHAVDASVLAYAVNRFAPEHAQAAAALEGLANGERPWALPWSATHEFLMLVTHPHAVARPLRPSDASSFLDELLRSPTVRLLSPTAAHARTVNEVLEMMPAGERGLPRGFETAVLLREHGIRELLSADRAMRAYRFLDVRDPVHGAPWSAAERPGRRYRVLRRPAARRDEPGRG